MSEVQYVLLILLYINIIMAAILQHPALMIAFELTI